jgi:(1->4)-alpha-D-glucan 1-alpha-D-glucosylmutase
LQALHQQLVAAGSDLLAVVRELLDTREDGRVKLYVTHRALSYRRERQDLFLQGEYVPVAATGPLDRHISAFARRYGNHAVLLVVPRLLAQVIPDPTTLPLGPELWSDSWLLLPPD